jgi:hypothetical protein
MINISIERNSGDTSPLKAGIGITPAWVKRSERPCDKKEHPSSFDDCPQIGCWGGQITNPVTPDRCLDGYGSLGMLLTSVSGTCCYRQSKQSAIVNKNNLCRVRFQQIK